MLVNIFYVIQDYGSKCFRVSDYYIGWETLQSYYIFYVPYIYVFNPFIAYTLLIFIVTVFLFPCIFNLRVISFFRYFYHFCRFMLLLGVILMLFCYLFVSNLHWTLSLRSGEYMSVIRIFYVIRYQLISFMASFSNSFYFLLISSQLWLSGYLRSLSVIIWYYHFIGIAALFVCQLSFIYFFRFLVYFFVFLYFFINYSVIN